MLKLLSAFFLSSALVGVCAGAIGVYVFGHIDPKFRDSLGTAFELELITAGGLTVIGTVLVSIACAMVNRHITSSRRALAIAFAWGAAYPLLLRFAMSPFIGIFDAESIAVPVMGWIYLLGFPLLISIPLATCRDHPNAHGQASAL